MQVLGAYSPVPVSTVPASSGNLIPSPSGYTQVSSCAEIGHLLAPQADTACLQGCSNVPDALT